LYFQKMMTWVNEPPCANCGAKGSKCVGVRGAVTPEEKEGGASRVELYHCHTCNAQTTTFPRYNSPIKIFETKRGRCGEYANLCGFMLHCCGYDVRYISDFTDHVWVEVWSNRMSKWIHVDGCEGATGANSMYEHGWGKKLNYILAFLPEHVADVTKRYTRKFDTAEFQVRRREYSASETMSDMIIAQANAALSGGVNKKRLEELIKRHEMEIEFWKSVENKDWKDCEEGGELYSEGRLSGSFAWRSARNEIGQSKNNEKKGQNTDRSDSSLQALSSNFFRVERYHPTPHSTNNEMVISLKPPLLAKTDDNNNKNSTCIGPDHDCINISSVSCAAGLYDEISIVIVDEKTKCILQSRSFSNWTILQEFVETVPDDRIVLIVGSCKEAEEKDEVVIKRKLESRLGGFTFPTNEKEEKKTCLLYAGQMNRSPSWSTSLHTQYGSTANVTLTISTSASSSPSVPLKVCRESNMIPSAISKRLPESIMPLATQLLATGEQKHIAFSNFLKKQEEKKESDETVYVGYTTAKGAPIYLFTASDGFPFQRCGNGGNFSSDTTTASASWHTYHFLPEPLVPQGYDAPPPEEEGGNIIIASSRRRTAIKPKFDIPTETTFFNNLFGPSLLFHPNSNETITLDTETALSNSRLVALYFSAHWCPPCRRFTPMLIEMYQHLKEDSILPTHGLEIVFVSSDRDEQSFGHYYNSMPWLAVPFNTLQPMIKGRFGVNGIPALVVLDSMTGDVVVNMQQSKSDVMRACQGGDEAIERLVKEEWLGQMLSMESRAIVESLEMSCLDDGTENCNEQKDENNNDVDRALEVELDDAGKAYLTRTIPTKAQASQSTLVMDPNVAAAKAIQILAEEQKTKQISNPSERIKEIFMELTTPKEVKVVLEKGPLDKSGMVQVTNVTNIDKSLSSFHLTPPKAAERVEFLNQSSNTNSSRSMVRLILATAKKYLDNVYSNPSSFKYRQFKLSNKVFDRISSTAGGLDLVKSIGFMIYFGGIDYMACIPLGMDLQWMQESLNKLLDSYDATNDEEK